MNVPHIRRIVALIIAGGLALSSSRLLAQEPEGSATSESLAITQGRAAILLASSLGFYVGEENVLTPERATQLLMQNGISPMGGWQVNELLTLNQLAAILGQALEVDTDFTEEQKSDPTAKAYKDALVMEYDLDLENLVPAAIRVTSGPNDNAGQPGFDQPIRFDTDQYVTPDLLNQAINFIPVSGGDSGQVDGGSSNITPSAP